MPPGRLAISLGVAGALAGGAAFTLQAQQSSPSSASTQPRPRSVMPASALAAHSRSAAAAPHVALIDEYCLSCHDQDHEKGGLVLEHVASEEVARHPEVWEKVVRKLRARQMPPVGKDRPDEG